MAEPSPYVTKTKKTILNTLLRGLRNAFNFSGKSLIPGNVIIVTKHATVRKMLNTVSIFFPPKN